MITLRVFGKPRPQARPRRGEYKNFYSPKNEWFKAVYLSAVQVRPAVPMSGPVFLGVEFIFPRPKQRKVNGWHVSRPDIDNLIKAVADAVVLARWMTDDAELCVHVAAKRYAKEGEQPGANIRVVELAPDAEPPKNILTGSLTLP